MNHELMFLYKRGDEVILKRGYSVVPLGTQGVISGVDKYDFKLPYHVTFPDFGSFWLSEDELEPASIKINPDINTMIDQILM